MIVKAALLLFRTTNNTRELLFVKTYDRDFYIFPGGVQEDNEELENTLRRESKNGLGVELQDIKKLGEVNGATPSGVPLQMHMFTAEVTTAPAALGNNEKLWWMSRSDATKNKEHLTPIALEQVFPFLEAHKLW